MEASQSQAAADILAACVERAESVPTHLAQKGDGSLEGKMS